MLWHIFHIKYRKSGKKTRQGEVGACVIDMFVRGGFCWNIAYGPRNGVAIEEISIWRIL